MDMDVERKKRIQQYGEQMAIFLVGLSAVTIIAYVIVIFRPYIYPVLLAAIVVVPIVPLTMRLQRILLMPSTTKIKVISKSSTIMYMAAFFQVVRTLFGMHLGILAVFSALLVFLCTRGIGPKTFLSLSILIGGSILILMLVVTVQELTGVYTGIVRRTLGQNSAIKAELLSSMGHLDQWAKTRFGTGIYELASKVLTLLSGEEINAETPAYQSGPEALGKLLLHLKQIRDRLEWKKLADRAKDLFTGDSIMTVSSYILRWLVKVLQWLAQSAQMVIQTLTFLYFLFYFIDRKQRILVYILESFYWIDQVALLITEVNHSLEFTISQYYQRITLQLAASYVVFSSCGSQLSMMFAILSTMLVIFPLVDPLVIALFVSIELFMSGQRAMSVLCGILYLFVSIWGIPSATLYKIPNSSYFAQLSVLVGFWTFGVAGLVLGPVLASLPSIIYRISADLTPTEQVQKTQH